MGATAAIIPLTPVCPTTVRSNTSAASRVHDLHRTSMSCANCCSRQVCLPCGLSESDAHVADELVQTRRRVKRGESVFHAGDPFKAVYLVRSGFYKTFMVTDDGRDQITGFQMAGELLGMDGIENDLHSATAEALDDGEVCVIPYAWLEDVSSRVRGVQHQFHRMLSREIVRDQGVMMLLGTLRAEERVAMFLLNLSKRFQARGYAATEFHLRMTREEIGSYLGLKLETVSRIFSKFQQFGLILVQQKHVRICDIPGLQYVVSASARQ